MAINPNPIDVYVGSRIKMQRRIREMSQTDLGDAVGLTFQQIQKYENGKNRVSSSRLQQFASILNVPASFFFEGAPGLPAHGRKSHESDHLVELSNTYGGLDLAKAFMRIRNRATRRKIADLLEAMVEAHGD